MLSSFLNWLDSYASRRGVPAVIGALIALLSFAGLLGTVFGSQMVRAGAFVCVGLLVVVGVLSVLADRRRMKIELDTHRRLLAKYCDLIIDHRPEPLLLVDNWKQVTYVQLNGDVRETIQIQAVVLRKLLYFVRFISGSEWAQPDKYHEQVGVNVRSFTDDNAGVPQWHVTKTWREDGRMNSIVHLEHPIRGGSHIKIVVERFWPAKCKPLMCDRVADYFTFRTTKLLQIRKVEQSIVLPEGFTAKYGDRRLNENPCRVKLTSAIDADGRQVITWRFKDLPVFDSVGMWLRLK